MLTGSSFYIVFLSFSKIVNQTCLDSRLDETICPLVVLDIVDRTNCQNNPNK